MKLSEKIVKLRKNNGWSQEDLAEKLNVSRQAISRWEGDTAQPDAMNILLLSKIFGVTTDYLLNDDYESDSDIPVVQTINQANDDLFFKKKQQHLISAICFTIASISSVIGIVTSNNTMQLGLASFMSTLCIANAVAQFVLYARKH